MFCYKQPRFEKKRLLRAEMLEQLRDYPKDYLEIRYAGYSDGILCGCELEWNQDVLTVQSGIIRYKNKLYFMKEPLHIQCKAEDKIRYVKVQFLALVSENEQVVGNTRVYLDDKEPDEACELELCRFRLQDGARLRNTYESFSDCTTQFDTIHLIDVPWSAPTIATLHPKILKQYATEILQHNGTDNIDVGFAMNVLVNQGVVPANAIQIYIKNRLGCPAKKGNKGLYAGLKKILETHNSHTSEWNTSRENSRQVILI